MDKIIYNVPLFFPLERDKDAWHSIVRSIYFDVSIDRENKNRDQVLVDKLAEYSAVWIKEHRCIEFSDVSEYVRFQLEWG